MVAIYRQLVASDEPDHEELCAWIQTVTKSSDEKKKVLWEGERNIIDMRDWVLKYYFAPEANGSNSIKDILPAILNNSAWLKDKYGKSIYGRSIKSLNFSDKQWVILDDNQRVINPYKRLDPVFEGMDEEFLDKMLAEEDAEVCDGGAAMIAYAQMRFTQMTDAERELMKKSLLRYCELDTLAMVMIWEGWKDLVA